MNQQKLGTITETTAKIAKETIGETPVKMQRKYYLAEDI